MVKSKSKEKTKRSTAGNDQLEELIDSLKDAELSIGESLTEVQEEPTKRGILKSADVKSEVDIEFIRDELIKSSENGEINQSVKYLKKASARVIEKIHKQVERNRLQKTSAIITDTLLSTFASMLGGMDAVASSDDLNDDLQKDGLLKRDVERIATSHRGYPRRTIHVAPILPFLGIMSGVLTTGKHVYKHNTSCIPIEGTTDVKGEATTAKASVGEVTHPAPA